MKQLRHPPHALRLPTHVFLPMNRDRQRKLPSLKPVMSFAHASHLRSVTAAPHAHTDVHVGKSRCAQEQHRLVGLLAEDGRLEKLDGAAVHLDEAAAALAVSDGGGGLLLKGKVRQRSGAKRGDNKSYFMCPMIDAAGYGNLFIYGKEMGYWTDLRFPPHPNGKVLFLLA